MGLEFLYRNKIPVHLYRLFLEMLISVIYCIVKIYHGIKGSYICFIFSVLVKR